ncbi:MAG: aspartyl-tRNA(Asn)/glutamyl-tRNA(Gln) amidotransferase subunit [Thermotogota bacterium]|nr:aspartyl-tRNA(Asn)/glutamyl-tRNA(Gln) amidotransferase subunit [Thermotogota bacterium]
MKQLKIKINDDLFEKIERLAKLSLEPQEREELKKDLNEILAYMEMLDELNVSNVEPLYTPVESETSLREDQVKEFDNVQGIVGNFPEEEDGLLKVSKVIQREEKSTKK